MPGAVRRAVFNAGLQVASLGQFSRMHPKTRDSERECHCATTGVRWSDCGHMRPEPEAPQDGDWEDSGACVLYS